MSTNRPAPTNWTDPKLTDDERRAALDEAWRTRTPRTIPLRERRRASMGRDLETLSEYLWDFPDDRDMATMLRRAYPVGDTGTDKALRDWTAEDFDVERKARYRAARRAVGSRVCALVSAREFDGSVQRYRAIRGKL